jgi:uncharacterized protein YecT (DUF1311 family)
MITVGDMRLVSFLKHSFFSCQQKNYRMKDDEINTAFRAHNKRRILDL